MFGSWFSGLRCLTECQNPEDHKPHFQGREKPQIAHMWVCLSRDFCKFIRSEIASGPTTDFCEQQQNFVTPSKRVLLKKLIVTHLVKKLSTSFMEPEGLLPHSVMP